MISLFLSSLCREVFQPFEVGALGGNLLEDADGVVEHRPKIEGRRADRDQRHVRQGDRGLGDLVKLWRAVDHDHVEILDVLADLLAHILAWDLEQIRPCLRSFFACLLEPAGRASLWVSVDQ